MTYLVHTHGHLSGLTWGHVKAFSDRLAEFCDVSVTPDRVVSVPLGRGEITLHWSDRETRVTLRATAPEALQGIRDTLAYTLEQLEPGLPDAVRWADHVPQEGSRPPNFRIARLLSRKQITPKFIRLRLAAEDLGFMTRGGLHLRLLQPRDPGAPVWPRLSANGRTIWPEPEQLHKPVYTIRAMDADGGWLDVDVFIHGNGPTCAWAMQAQPGDVVGISGPGGGGLINHPGLLLGSDETALPVIARQLEAAPATARGRAIIEVSDPAEIQPLNHPQGVTLDWLIRGRDAPLRQVFKKELDRFLDDTLEGAPDREVFFGGEKADAQALRTHLRAPFPRLPEQITLAAYWSR